MRQYMSVLGHLAFGVRQYMRQYMSVLGHLAFGALGDESRRCDNGQSLVLEVRAELHSQGHHLLVLLPQASHSKPLSILFSYFTWD